jgi:hypothetical protein
MIQLNQRKSWVLVIYTYLAAQFVMPSSFIGIQYRNESVFPSDLKLLLIPDNYTFN